MYLIDTNVWLELLLEQEKSKSVRHLLKTLDPSMLRMTEFSFYSIAIILVRLKKSELLKRFVRDILIEPRVYPVRLTPQDIETVLGFVERFHLDFDDAYQYTAAEKFNFQIVNFDTDFDKTERGRKTPAEVLEK